MKKNKGSNLAEYVIPIALIGIVAGLGLYYLISNDNFSNFISSSGNMQKNKNNSSLTINPNVEETDIVANTYSGSSNDENTSNNEPASPENPVKQCSGGTCTIDYGSFVLTGVPGNFSDFVQSSGSSGGTEELASLLDTLATIADGLDPPMDSSIIKRLANAGHDMAKTERSIETLSSALMSSAARDEDFKEPSQALGSNLSKFNNLLSSFNSQYSTLDQQNIAAIVNILSDEILSIGKNVNEYSSTIASCSDPNYMDSANNILNPDGSTITDIDSSIICNTGSGTDSGRSCH
ncbi:MAG: hypothetical protein AB1782_05065 [Cyanobacteriota bacterium]